MQRCSRWRQHAGAIHLLVADVVMPGLSGRDLAARLIADRPTLPADLLHKVRETLAVSDPQVP